MSKCQHNTFAAKVEVNRLTDTDDGPVNGFAADIKVSCSDCKMPFQWVGLERGVSFAKPMVSVNGLQLRAPITPVEEL